MSGLGIGVMLLSFLCAFDFAFLLEHFLGGLLTRASSGADIVPHATLGHGAILTLNHLGFHGLLAFGGLLRRTAHLDLDLDIALAFAFTFALHLFVAATT